MDPAPRRPATMIPHSRPTIGDDDGERVARVVRGGHLAQGPEVAAFERGLAERMGVGDAAAARRRTARTRAVVVVHPFGLGVDLCDFERLGVALVEDCAQTLGAVLGGRPGGARGGLAVCSFYATKLLTTGEGGAVTGRADL